MTAVASGRRPPTGKKAPRPKPRPEPPRSEPSQVDEQGALDAVEAGEPVGIPSAGGLLRGVASAVLQPGSLTRELGQLARDLGKVVRGTDELRPAPKDKRFADPAWTDNPLYRRWGQGYVALGQTMARLVDDLEAKGVDWHDLERARFAVNALTGALSPTNTLVGNPAALKRAFETGGRSVARGLGQFVSDVRHNGGMPSQTDRTAFTVGTDLALTPGAVVHRGPVAELIQYTPSTATVRQRPLLIIPPPIGRFYFLDLAPGRSVASVTRAPSSQVPLVLSRSFTRKPPPSGESSRCREDTRSSLSTRSFPLAVPTLRGASRATARVSAV